MRFVNGLENINHNDWIIDSSFKNSSIKKEKLIFEVTMGVRYNLKALNLMDIWSFGQGQPFCESKSHESD